jgi:hypothetical protein
VNEEPLLRHRRHSPSHVCVRAPGDREFSAGHQPCDGGGSALARTHPRVFFPAGPSLFSQPLFAFRSCTHRHHLHLHLVLFFRLQTRLDLDGYQRMRLHRLSLPTKSFRKPFPILWSLASHIPHPTSRPRQSTSSPPTGSNLRELGSSHFAHRWLAKRWRIQPRDLKFYCPPSFSALLPLIGRSREGPQRSPLDRQIA